MGRQSEYHDGLILDALSYLHTYADEGDVIPSIAGLALNLGVSRSVLYVWSGKHEAFRDTLETIKAAQEKIALNNGLSNKFNATITKLVLANHGYSDKTEVMSTTPKERMTLDDFYLDQADPEPGAS